MSSARHRAAGSSTAAIANPVSIRSRLRSREVFIRGDPCNEWIGSADDTPKRGLTPIAHRALASTVVGRLQIPYIRDLSSLASTVAPPPEGPTSCVVVGG